MAPIEALMVIFPGANTLDVNGPIETLFAPGRGAHFSITVASETDITQTAEGVKIKVWPLIASGLPSILAMTPTNSNLARHCLGQGADQLPRPI